MQFNIADLYEAIADEIPDKVVVVADDIRLTHAELDARANRLASYLRSKGVGAGDHIGLHLYNSAQFVEAMLAAFKIRAVPINVNYRYVSEELKYIFDNADLKAVIHQQELTSLVEDIAEESSVELFIALEDDSGVDVSDLGSVMYEDAMAAGSPERDFGERSGDDLYIVYTGGTTGMPRGVMWRQEDVFFSGLQGGRPGGTPIETPEEIREVARTGHAAQTIIPAAAFIHGAAQWGAWIAILSGGKVVIIPGRSFRPKAVWRAVDSEQASTITLVGDAMCRPLVDCWSDLEPKPDISTLFVVASAGAVLSHTVKDQLEEILPGRMILNNFGASEAGHAGMANPDDKGGQITFFMHETVAVLDPDNGYARIEPGSEKTGFLARRGRLPLGYYKDPAKTARTFVEIDGVRWAIPGDMAQVTEDGMVLLLGRGSVCINSGGEKVFPEEVEMALKSHPAVFDAVVVGIPDEKWMERVMAVVQLYEGKEATFEEIDAQVRKKVAGYKAPRGIVFVGEVARQPSGKPDYRWAKEVAVAGKEIF